MCVQPTLQEEKGGAGVYSMDDRVLWGTVAPGQHPGLRPAFWRVSLASNAHTHFTCSETNPCSRTDTVSDFQQGVHAIASEHFLLCSDAISCVSCWNSDTASDCKWLHTCSSNSGRGAYPTQLRVVMLICLYHFVPKS